ncbi:MAG: hypothetical protein HXY18_15195 [Bryobacteraceae bacterium]|nr:hypothetical protein [Bryobacteraceae bacterium]
MKKLILCAASALVISGTASANSTGAPVGSAGVPGEGTCTDCHGGTPNTGPGRIRVALVDAANYAPGGKVRLRVTLEDPAAARWGFNLTARTTSNVNNPAGTFTITDATNTRLNTGGGNIQYVTHTSAGTRRGTSGSSSWEVEWTGPQSGESVTFFVAGNAANNDGQSGSGDRIYTHSLDVDSGSVTAATTRILSQFVFGGGSPGFYTGIYLHNTGTSPAAVNVSFYNNDGTPLSVPSLGGATTLASVAAGGVVLIEAPNSGPLQQGWAKVELPDGVIGYGVFRQSVAGRADQEAVVPFAGSNSARSTLIFDDAGLTTAVAVANPTESAVTVSATAKSNSGTVLGTSSIDLPARGKAAFNLAGNISGVAGHRGSAEFSVSSGAASVLGLRFGGEAFTSIPAFESGPAAAGARVLSQFVFGGGSPGFYTAIYLHNTGTSSAAVTVSFFNNDGTPLNVPALGGTATTVNVAAGGVSLVEAPNTGALQQGWARIDLPSGVLGYGVFRQSVNGRADQEAVVPLAGSASARSTLIFDDAGLTTAVALANPTDSPVTVSIAAKSNSGAALGSSTVNLPARGKTAFNLRANIPAVAGQRGSADFTVSSGAVSVLGLRFGGEAFTSIPATER